MTTGSRCTNPRARQARSPSDRPIALAAGTAVRTLQEFLVTAKWEHTAARDRLQRRMPEEGLAANDPRVVVAEAVTYLGNNRDRMDYPRYRREGLPTTSSLVESLVGEFGTQVKGRQKHWTRPGGAESILQLRAALLSEDGRLERYCAHRPGSAFRKRPRPASHELQTAN